MQLTVSAIQQKLGGLNATHTDCEEAERVSVRVKIRMFRFR